MPFVLPGAEQKALGRRLAQSTGAAKLAGPINLGGWKKDPIDVPGLARTNRSGRLVFELTIDFGLDGSRGQLIFRTASATRTERVEGIFRMEMHQIRYFLAVARTLHFTRAAEECHVTQPALTRAIHLLEEELGGELLRRERTLTHLTVLGQRMLPLMRQCYESALSAKSLAHSINSGEVTALSFAISRTINLTLLMASLRELSRACPSVQLRLSRGSGPEVAEFLKTGEADLALAGPLGLVWERLDSWPLFTEPFELVVNREHRFAGRNRVELDQLSDERLLVLAECEMAEELSLRLCGQGITTAGAHQVTTDHDLLALLEANLGVAIVPASARRSERLRSVPLEGLDLNRTVAVYGIAGRKRSPVATMLLNLLRAADWSRYIH